MPGISVETFFRGRVIVVQPLLIVASIQPFPYSFASNVQGFEPCVDTRVMLGLGVQVIVDPVGKF